MDNIAILATTSIINVLSLLILAGMFFRRKNIVNLLAGLAMLSLLLLELAKSSILMNWGIADRLVGIGIFLLPLFWFVLSVALIPQKSKSLYRMIISPALGFISLIFFLIWWVNPSIFFEINIEQTMLSKFSQYFSIVFIFNLSFSLSNIERGAAILKRRRLRFFLLGTAFSLIPYLFLATYALLFAQFNVEIFKHSVISVFISNLFFFLVAKDGLSPEKLKEEAVVNTSLTLFLVGGYLFFLGAFIKIFQVFEWNLNVLFSVLTAIFIVVVTFIMVFSSSVRLRIRYFLLRNFTRQKYDWQKIWEDFTYRISQITEPEQLKLDLADAVKIIIFDDTLSLENEFLDWILRKGGTFEISEVLTGGFSDKYPQASAFFQNKGIEKGVPLYGNKKIIGLMGLTNNENQFIDEELLKVISLQASSVILNCLAYKTIREAEKRESLYRVSSFILHDVKNYINNLSLLVVNKDKFDKPEFQKDALFTLEHTIGKMKHLVDEFKTLREDIRLEKRNFDFSQLVHSILTDLSGGHLKNIEIDNQVPVGFSVYGDAHYLSKVIMNLIINAVEATKGIGRLKIATNRSRNQALLFFSDNGCGITKQFVDNNLFRPFQSTKDKGLGIGLYQCKMIIEAHGGQIEVASQENEGTEFIIKLPDNN
jgi:signal transduction histidine kinase